MGDYAVYRYISQTPALAEGGFFFLLFLYFEIYFSRTHPLICDPLACKDNDANCRVYSITHLFVRVGRIDNYIFFIV